MTMMKGGRDVIIGFLWIMLVHSLDCWVMLEEPGIFAMTQ